MNSFMKKALSLLMVLCLVVLTVGLSVKVNAAGESYSKVELSDISASDKVIIVSTKGTAHYAMSNDKGTDAAPTAVAVTVTDNTITTEATNIFWNISKTNDGLIIYPDGVTDKWLYSTTSNNGIRVGTSDNKLFKIEEKSNYLYNIATSRYVGVYQNSDWRSYTSLHANIADQTFSFYKLVSSGYTVTFDDGTGQNVSTQNNVSHGALISAPADPVKANYTFQGWYDGDKMWDFTTDTVKGNLTLTAKWVSNVLANLSVPLNNIKSYMSMGYRYSKIGGVNTDVLTADLFTATSTTYFNFTNVTDNSTAKYSGKTAKGNNVIQLRSSNSDSGIITIESGGFAKKITVDWNTNTSDGRTIDIYGKNTAYEATADLYDTSKRGTKIGSIVKGTSTELVINGDYEYIGIRSSSGALYATSITIEWDNSSYYDVDFRIRCGIDSSISNAVSGLTGATYGIEVSDGTTTKKYLSTNTLYKNDSNGKDYVVISLGDVLNNPERLDKEFTVRAFVEYDGETVYSTATKTYSVVTLVKEYLNDATVASQIEGFKNILVSFGKTFE